jgi:hypothetical protein
MPAANFRLAPPPTTIDGLRSQTQLWVFSRSWRPHEL